MQPEVTVIIVSYNCSELLAACLTSLAHTDRDVEHEVIVVDNDSHDDTVEMVEQRFPHVKVIANHSNLGFSVANNIAIRQAQGRYVLLLNPDTVVKDPSTLKRFVAFMDSSPDVGVAGGELVHASGHKQVSAGYAPGPLTLFAFSFFLARLSNNIIKGVSLLPIRDKRIVRVDVDWVCGACMIVRRACMDEAGLMDESYFLYGEDIEWGCRIARSGWKVSHLPSIRIEHVEGGTQKSQVSVSTAWLDGLARVYADLNPGSSRLYFKTCLGAGLAMRTLMYGLAASLTRDPWPRQRVREMSTWLRYLLASSGGRGTSGLGPSA